MTKLKDPISLAGLEHGEYYKGVCRNASIARWNGETRRFIYSRYKFGNSYFEEINHFEDDDGYDLFFPSQKIDWGVDFIPLTT